MTEPYFNTKLQSESYNFFYRNTLLKMERQIRKKIQLIAARIVTSLPIIASRESLYFETWWGKIYSRRKISRQKTMYRIDQNILSSYIMDISPNKSTSVSNYSSRYAQNYSLPHVVRNYINLRLFLLLFMNGMHFQGLSMKAIMFAF